MASACGLLSSRKNVGKGMEQAEPLTLHGLGREWMYRHLQRELSCLSPRLCTKISFWNQRKKSRSIGIKGRQNSKKS